MKRHFYVTDFNPNGTQDLLITDCDGNIIDTLSEAIYGLHVRPEKGQICLNTIVVTDNELRKSLMDAPENLTLVYPVNSSNLLLRHVAVSPVCDGTKTKEFITRHSK